MLPWEWVDTLDVSWINIELEDNNMPIYEQSYNEMLVPMEFPFATGRWDGPLHKTIDVVDINNMTITVNRDDLATASLTVLDPNFSDLVPGQVIKLLLTDNKVYIVRIWSISIDEMLFIIPW